MIHMKQLTEHDVGRRVHYTIHKGPGDVEAFPGVITSWNEEFIFVKYEDGGPTKATRPEDLTFIERKSR